MFKSIFWKEWRENRVFILLGIGVVCLLNYIFYLSPRFRETYTLFPSMLGSFTSMGDYFYGIFSLLPLFLIPIAVNLISSEYRQNTMAFLFNHPISRSKLWLSKISIGFIFLIIMIISKDIITILISFTTPHPYQYDPILGFSQLEYKIFNAILISSFFYAASIFIATMVSNMIAAGFGGFIFSWFIAYLWGTLGRPFIISSGHGFTSLWIPAILMLLVSWIAFALRELMTKKRRTVFALSMFTIGFAALYVGINTLGSTETMQMAAIERIAYKGYIPQTNEILVYTARESEFPVDNVDFGNPQYWFISLADGKKEKAPGRGFSVNDSFTDISPDGKYYLFTPEKKKKQTGFYTMGQEHQWLLMDTKTRQVKSVFKGKDEKNKFTPLLWTPDSKNILYYSRDYDQQSTWFELVNIDNGETKFIASLPSSEIGSLRYPLWAPDYKSFYLVYYFSGGNEPSGHRDSVDSITQISLDGKILWSHHQWGTNSSSIINPITGSVDYHDMISPDRKWLVFSDSTAYEGDINHLYLANLYTKKTTAVLQGDKFDDVYWSPDHKWAVILVPIKSNYSEKMKKADPFFETENEVYSLWAVNLETLEPGQLLLPSVNRFEQWSVDSKWFSYWVPAEEGKWFHTMHMNIYTHETRDSNLNINYEEQRFSELPNGQKLDIEGSKLKLISADGRETKQLFP